MTRSEHQTDDTPGTRGRGRRVLELGAAALAAAAGFGALAKAAARRDTAPVDHAVHELTAADPDSPVREVAEAVKPVGKWYTYLPMAAAASAWVLAAPGASEARRSRLAGAGALLLTGTVATYLNPAFDKWLPQPPAPPGHPPDKPVFPSGHAFGPGAVSMAAAYVMAREGVASPAVALPAALAVPLVTAGARVIAEKHWASDVLGGYLGAAALAAACLTTYEAAAGA